MFLKRTTRALAAVGAAALSAVAVTSAGGGMAAAAPPSSAPSFTATLSHKSSCLFTAKAAWKNAAVDHIYVTWYVDDTFVATSEAPGTGPNGAPLGSHSATFQAGTFVQTPGAAHAWYVRAQFYNGGAFVQEVLSKVDSAQCAVTAAPA